MKLAICIPAYNEEQTIARVIEAIPWHISGIQSFKIFVIDDGSIDKTTQVANEALQKFCHAKVEPFQVDRTFAIVRVVPNRGLANAFLQGIKSSLSWGADIIVNIDADGQYRPEEIPKLVQPLLEGLADMVIGDRQVKKLQFMPISKRIGNMAGSFFIRVLTGTHIRDASSGFRAYTRKAATNIQIDSKHTYTHENLIQSHYLGLHIAQIPITFVARTDGTSSRLIHGRLIITGVIKHIFKSLYWIFHAWRRWRRKSKIAS